MHERWADLKSKNIKETRTFVEAEEVFKTDIKFIVKRRKKIHKATRIRSMRDAEIGSTYKSSSAETKACLLFSP